MSKTLLLGARSTCCDFVRRYKSKTNEGSVRGQDGNTRDFQSAGSYRRTVDADGGDYGLNF